MARKASFDRNDVLGRARDLFWAKGFHATSMKDLEVALDLRPGSIYAAFGSKEALYGEALQLYASERSADLAAALGKSDSALEGLAGYVRALVASFGRPLPSRACMVVKTILEMPEDDPVLRASAERLIRATEAAFAAAFQRAKDNGELPDTADPKRMGRRFQADIIGLRAYAQRSGSVEDTAALAEDIALDIEALRVA